MNLFETTERLAETDPEVRDLVDRGRKLSEKQFLNILTESEAPELPDGGDFATTEDCIRYVTALLAYEENLYAERTEDINIRRGPER